MSSNTFSSRIQQQLERRRLAGLTRATRLRDFPSNLHFGSNDYLALSTHPALLAELNSCSRVGASASRLVSGTLDSHLRCESLLAEMCMQEAALVFGSGYHANLGLLQAVLSRHDIVIADRCIHASMIDGVNLAGARLRRFAHNSSKDLRACLEQVSQERSVNTEVFILVEALYSINGDVAPISEIVALANEFNAVCIIDEAHSFAALGPEGGGLVRALGLSTQVDFISGSFAKAVGTYGGFIACSSLYREYLLGKARSFIYSTAVAQPIIAASTTSLGLIREADAQRGALGALARQFRLELGQSETELGEFCSYIVPLYVEGNQAVQALSAHLEGQGIFAYPMRSPTVASGEECLRFSITLHQSPADIERTCEALRCTGAAFRLAV